MERFSKYRFIKDLQAELFDQAERNQFSCTDSIVDFVCQEIDTAVIYTSNCYAIMQELNVYDFEFELGVATNACQAAYYALWECVFEEISVEEVWEHQQSTNNIVRA
jgi:hypothetical protein